MVFLGDVNVEATFAQAQQINDAAASAVGPSQGGHGDADRAWKQRLCVPFAQGLCQKGAACAFAHGPEEMMHHLNQGNVVSQTPASSSKESDAQQRKNPPRPAPVTRDQLVPQKKPRVGVTHPLEVMAVSGIKRRGFDAPPCAPLAPLPDMAKAPAVPKMMVGTQLVDPHMWKTRLCQFWMDGNCPQGDICTFAHGKQELAMSARGAENFEIMQKAALKTTMCVWFGQGSCRRGSQCPYSHGAEELEHARTKSGDHSGFGDAEVTAARSSFDFTGLSSLRGEKDFAKTFLVPEEHVPCLMTARAKDLLLQSSGAAAVTWDQQGSKVKVEGEKAKVERAGELIMRVATHCLWGICEAKVAALIRPQTDYVKATVRFSPMVPQLKSATASLDASHRRFRIGTDPANDMCVKGPLCSRSHTMLEFNPSKGAVYVTDTSTNGTFVNGRRLPSKGSACVVLWHGDEMLLQDPALGGNEFGFMVNIEMT